MRKYYKTSNRKEFYQKKFIEQNGRCAICGVIDRLVVDHDHNNGLMRGLLCYSHNTALGLFADNPELLRKAAEYVENVKAEQLIETQIAANTYNPLESIIKALIDDPSYPSDRARARKLAEITGSLLTTAQTRLYRLRKRLTKK